MSTVVLGSDDSLTGDEDVIILLPHKQGPILKWTNYLSGWQERHVVLSEGCISYYRNEEELDICRGSYNLKNCKFELHDYDDLRFELFVQNQEDDIYLHFRSETYDEFDQWVDAIKQTQKLMQDEDSSANSKKSSRQMSSSSSITSNISNLSTSQKGIELFDSLNEMETYRALVTQHLQSLQKKLLENAETLEIVGSENINKETLTFKATANGLFESLKECSSLMKSHDEGCQLRMLREKNLRKKAEYELEVLKRQLEQQRRVSHAVPDMEEGPHSILKEHEFFDALEDQLDYVERRENNLLEEKETRARPLLEHHTSDEEEIEVTDDESSGGKKKQKYSKAYLKYKAKIDEGFKRINSMSKDEVNGDTWEAIEITDEYQLYRHDVIVPTEDNTEQIDDALIAFATLPGITAKECCHYFYDLDVRREWEAILESYKVLEQLSENTLVLNQSYVRVWPAHQRDVTFLSHLRLDDEKKSACVVNFSLHNHEADVIPPGFVRATCAVSMKCQTIIAESAKGKSPDQLTRDDVSVEMIYTGNVSPGGWVPSSAVRAASRREYPKFVQRIGKFCYDHMITHKKPVSL